MAHRSNVVQVLGRFDPWKDEPEMVKDPFCGNKISRKESRHVLFRPETTYYFCSKDCMESFRAGKKPSEPQPKQSVA